MTRTYRTLTVISAALMLAGVVGALIVLGLLVLLGRSLARAPKH